MNDLTVNLNHELAQRDFLGQPLYATDKIYALGDYWYRAADASQFLQFVHYLCLHDSSAEAILRLLGAETIN
ncbi:MAG: hypothetical protein DUD28_10745 [Lactobacillus sp.]|jgi:hypothetical protein|nr:MAG: hypothetical protein DUD28_10745 [Lactobacillus sp.]